MRNNRVLIALLLAGFVIRISLIWAGWCDRYIIADDAYYYFTIARNMVAGLGPTFDGLAPTNGFHPLYLLSLLPLFFVAHTSDPLVPIHLGLTFCTVCDLVTGIFLYKLFHSLDMRRGALWATALWLISPFGLLITLRGLEASLHVLCVAIVFVVAAQWLRNGLLGGRRAPLLGGLIGLSALARTDTIVFLGIAGCAMVWIAHRQHAAALRETIIALVRIGLGIVLVVIPWLLWNLATFGSLLQVSGTVKMINHRIFGTLVRESDPIWVISLLRQIAGPLWVPVKYFSGEEFTGVGVSAILSVLIIGLLGIITVVLWRWLRQGMRSDRKMILIAMIVYLISHWVIYAFVVRAYVVWYAVVPVFLCMVFGGFAIEAPETSKRFVRAATGTVFIVSAAVFLSFFLQTTRAGSSSILDDLSILERLQDIDDVHTVGVYNAGAMGYFAPQYGLAVVNLDGLVNNQLVDEWRRGKATEYINEHIDILFLPTEKQLNVWCSSGEKETLLRLYPRRGDSRIYGPRIRAAAN